VCLCRGHVAHKDWGIVGTMQKSLSTKNNYNQFLWGKRTYSYVQDCERTFTILQFLFGGEGVFTVFRNSHPKTPPAPFPRRPIKNRQMRTPYRTSFMSRFSFLQLHLSRFHGKNPDVSLTITDCYLTLWGARRMNIFLTSSAKYSDKTVCFGLQICPTLKMTPPLLTTVYTGPNSIVHSVY
jgi:hypothetical protein